MPSPVRCAEGAHEPWQQLVEDVGSELLPAMLAI
jgi:hypothetical protein